MKLSLVIPCYNEAANLPLLVDRCVEVARGNDLEVVFVDNGSVDETPDVLSRLTGGHDFARTVRLEQNQGYGGGILAGLRAAKGDILSWTHADMQTDPGDAITGLGMFAASSAPERLFVKGRRYGRPFFDVVFTIGMSIFELILMRRLMWDINAQPTMFSRAFFESWKNPPADFSLDLFAYYRAMRDGLTVRRFPVLFGERAHGVSHWNVSPAAKVKFIKRTLSYSFSLARAEARHD
ncbi:MAG: glycosyltransferase family 2 protein [Alphaproteobacteria bacterium]